MMSSGGKPIVDQELVGARADLDLALLGVGLALLVERHDHDRGAVARHLAGVVEERLLAFLHADRIDDRLADDAFQPGLDHAPLGAVDHDRHAGDVGLGGDQLEEGGHRQLGVEQALVHVDVDDLRAVLDLLARDLDGGGVVAGEDQLLERAEPVTLVRSPMLTKAMARCWSVRRLVGFAATLTILKRRIAMLRPP